MKIEIKYTLRRRHNNMNWVNIENCHLGALHIYLSFKLLSFTWLISIFSRNNCSTSYIYNYQSPHILFCTINGSSKHSKSVDMISHSTSYVSLWLPVGNILINYRHIILSLQGSSATGTVIGVMWDALSVTLLWQGGTDYKLSLGKDKVIWMKENAFFT